MQTTVVNKRFEPCDVYIGRPSIFGNPFSEKKYGRQTCIAMYKDYFEQRIAEEPAFREAVLELRGKRLGCWCKPLACHGDIIKEWLENNHA